MIFGYDTDICDAMHERLQMIFTTREKFKSQTQIGTPLRLSITDHHERSEGEVPLDGDLLNRVIIRD